MAHLTIFGLCPRCTDKVVCYLVQQGVWDAEMIYDADATILMTTTDAAAQTIHSALDELNIDHRHEHINRATLAGKEKSNG